jgi:rod shape-determining protein MreD
VRPVNLGQIYLALLAGFILYLLPWAGFGLLVRPDFVLLVLLYWLMRAPHLCNIGTAWLMGVLVDLAGGDLFGQHALAYVVAAFIAITYLRRATLFNRWQQAAYIFLLLLVSQIVLLVLKLFSGNTVPDWSYFVPSISGILLWQLVILSKIKVMGDQET